MYLRLIYPYPAKLSWQIHCSICLHHHVLLVLYKLDCTFEILSFFISALYLRMTYLLFRIDLLFYWESNNMCCIYILHSY